MGFRRWGSSESLAAWRPRVPGPAAPVSCLPVVPGTLRLNTWLQVPGNTLNVTLLTSHETTNLNWFLRRTGSPRPIRLQPGTHVSLTSSQGQAVLSICNISHQWQGSRPVRPSSSLFFSFSSLSPSSFFVYPPLPFLFHLSNYSFWKTKSK